MILKVSSQELEILKVSSRELEILKVSSEELEILKVSSQKNLNSYSKYVTVHLEELSADGRK